MKETYEKKLYQMAELAILRGIALEPGQKVYISAPTETYPVVEQLTKIAFEHGAANVFVRWENEIINELRTAHAPMEELTALPPWETEGMDQVAEEGGCFITIRSPHFRSPEIPAERQEAAKLAERAATQNVSNKRMTALCRWTVLLLPNADWARKVYPDLPVEEALEKLTDTLFDCARVQETGTVSAWDAHRNNLETRTKYLMDCDLVRLRYHNSLGTDFTVGLAEGHRWCGGGVYDVDGKPFIPNIPTEEIATAPDNRTASGTVAATMPFLFEGGMVEGMRLRFENGRVVEYSAERGQDVLERIIHADENEASRYLGEVALVPGSCPITKKQTLFYNTLLDENASCHLALGNGYAMCLQKGAKLTPEEMRQAGLNMGASIHVDFMIGSPDLEVTGETRDGREIPIFRSGEWAF